MYKSRTEDINVNCSEINNDGAGFHCIDKFVDSKGRVAPSEADNRGAGNRGPTALSILYEGCRISSNPFSVFRLY